MTTLVGARILAVGAGLPKAIVTNADLEKLVDTSDEWITARTGIKERRIASQDETASGLAIEAALDAISYAQIDPATIDMIIVATSTPDNLYPSTACMVQAAVKATRAAAFDLEAACTGFIYALSIAQQFIATKFYKRVLIIGVDVHSRFLDWEDRNTCVLFGDGAGAFIVDAIEDGGNELLATYLRADGRDGHLLCIPNHGTAYPHTGAVLPKKMDRFLQMNGRVVYEFAVNAFPEAVRSSAAKAGIEVKDIDYLVPHQANRRIINSAAERLGLKQSQIISNVDEMGNTSAASIPLAMWQAIKRNQIPHSSTVCLVGFGGGLTWGAAILKWTSSDKRPAETDKAEK